MDDSLEPGVFFKRFAEKKLINGICRLLFKSKIKKSLFLHYISISLGVGELKRQVFLTSKRSGK